MRRPPVDGLHIFPHIRATNRDGWRRLVTVHGCYRLGSTGILGLLSTSHRKLVPITLLSPLATPGTRFTGITGSQGPGRWHADGSSPWPRCATA
jgi:hypothetical protein